jgi:hypothetical protein
MISKSELQSVISKYSLGGLVDAVKWEVKDKTLTIDFQPPTREMVAKVVHTSFDLEDCEIAIYNTSQLDKLLAITSGDLNLQLEKQHKLPVKLVIEDASFTLNYSLSELRLIQEPDKVRDPNNYVVESNLESDAISAIIKAKNAIQSDKDNVNFTITTNFDNEQVLTMIFGDDSYHTNKVEYIVPNTVITGDHFDFNIPFNSEMVRVVLANNKDADKATMKLNINGLLLLEFESKNWKSTYYILRKANQ